MTHRLAGFVLVDLGIAAGLVAALVDLDDELTFTLWVLAAVLVVAGLSAVVLAWYLYPRARDDAELQDFGRPASATVLGVSERGVTSTGERRAELRLLVEPTNERPFNARREVTLADLPAIGEQLAVKFDPNRRRRVIVLR